MPWGSFLDGVENFDAEFFGLSPREAELMDPQQRVMLETAWEALEHAGLPPTGLAGTDTGVYVGVCTGDYGHRLLEDLPGIEAWTGIGAATCAVANRVSYALDLRGPSLAVDTACSASLVAVHLACQALRAGECEVALAGGVNLILSPGETLTLDAAGALAPDGRSKAFDAAADGYGRGEGCAVVVLKPMSAAVRDRDRILAAIIGSAVSQDGRTNGIMAPCGTAQEQVMLRACRGRPAFDPGTVDFVEAHGTGTAAGDPLEAAALAAVYGAGRPAQRPCLIGSVKSSIGHLAGAAGIAGLVRAVLAVQRGEIPPSRLDKPNPSVDWASGGLRVVTVPTPWPDGERPRRAAVSAFGYGGTIAHVAVEQPPPARPAPAPGPGGELFPVSAANAEALRQVAARLADHLDHPGVAAADLGHTLALRRAHLACRAVIAAADQASLARGLRALAAGDSHDAVTTGRVLRDPGPGPVFVFSGHGSQWAGMGRDLLAEPAFAAVIDSLEPVFTAEIGLSPRGMLDGGELTRVDRIEPMIFALQLGLVELWRGFGVTPHAVIGHSVGEIAAAVTAGALSQADAARLICRRSALLRRVAGRGAMAMVQLPFAETARRLRGRRDVVAAIASSPGSTVVSGDPDAVTEVLRAWLAEDVAARRVASDVAFHGPHMDPLLADLTAAAAQLDPAESGLRMYPTALDDPRATPRLDGRYWAANLRNPVRLAEAVRAAAADGYRAFLEISPHPVVTHSVLETLAAAGHEDIYVGVSLRRDRPALATLRANVAAAHCHGLRLDWGRLQPAGGLVTLPGYPWQRRRHWREPSAPEAGGRGHDPQAHSLLGDGIGVAGTDIRLWRTSLDDASRPYPGSHAIHGTEIVPAAVLVNTFFAASGGQVLDDVAMCAPLLTAERREIQVVRQDVELRLAARTAQGDQDASWQLIATAAVGPGATWPKARLGMLRSAVLQPGDPTLVRRRLAKVGVPASGFGWTIEQLLIGSRMLRARVRTGVVATSGAGAGRGDVDRAQRLRRRPRAARGRACRPDPDGRRPAGRRPDRGVPGRRERRYGHDRAGRRRRRHYRPDRRPALSGDRRSGPRRRGRPSPARPSRSPASRREKCWTGWWTMFRALIAGKMRLPPDRLTLRRPLIEQGLDSVLTVVIRRRLEQRFGCSLPAMLLWRQPTIVTIAGHLAQVLVAPGLRGDAHAP